MKIRVRRRVRNRCVCSHGKLLHFGGKCHFLGCDCKNYEEE